MPLAKGVSPTPSSRRIDWAQQVRKQWGKTYHEPDIAYRFSNGREFKSTDSTTRGFYRR